MHFCENCGNMYYIRLMSEDSDKLIYYCRKCNNKNEDIINDEICVSKRARGGALFRTEVTSTVRSRAAELFDPRPPDIRSHALSAPRRRSPQRMPPSDAARVEELRGLAELRKKPGGYDLRDSTIEVRPSGYDLRNSTVEDRKCKVAE